MAKHDPTRGGQFALIPAAVLYDGQLPATAKLLYGEIYRLSHVNGYCYASNRDFMALLQCSEKTVSRLIAALAERGHVRVRLVRRYGGTGDITQRRIFCGQELAREDPPEDVPGDAPEAEGGMDKNDHTSPQKCPEGMDKNVPHTTTSNINKKPPIVPQGDDARAKPKKDKSTPSWKPERFEAFWTYYRTHARGEDRKGAVRAWDKLKPDDGLIAAMGKALQTQVLSEDWRRGIGVPYAKTWLNNERWLDPPRETPDGPEPYNEEGYDGI